MRIVRRFLALLAFVGCLWSPLMAARANRCEPDQIQFAVSGKFKSAVDVQQQSGTLYLDAKQTVKLLGGTPYWYPKSKQLIVRLKKLRARFEAGTKNYTLDDKKEKLSSKVIMAGGKVYLPLEFFTSDAVASAVGKQVVFNDNARSLDVDSRYNVGDADYFSYGSSTRILFELHDVKNYTAEERNPRILEITVPSAQARLEERTNVNDGLVNSITVTQDGDNVKITVVFGKDKRKWTVNREGDTLVVEVNPDADTPKSIEKNTVKLKTELKPVEVKKSGESLRIPDAVIPGSEGKKRIVIDAGHGGKDPGGSRRKGMMEKDLNLAFAKELEDILEEDGSFDVLMTRTSDYFIPLAVRSDIANSSQADIFISIHANAHRKRTENGYEIYFMADDASDPWAAEVAAAENAVTSMEDNPSITSADMLLHSLARNEYMNEAAHLAGMIAKNVQREVPIKNRGVKQAAFYVLRGTYAPAVLVETGFMTNKKDADYINSKKVRRQFAQGIYEGIIEYAKARGWQ